MLLAIEPRYYSDSLKLKLLRYLQGDTEVTKERFTTIFTWSAGGVLDSVERDYPSIVIMDDRLPRGDSTEKFDENETGISFLYPQIRKMNRCVPIIIFTARFMDSHRTAMETDENLKIIPAHSDLDSAIFKAMGEFFPESEVPKELLAMGDNPVQPET